METQRLILMNAVVILELGMAGIALYVSSVLFPGDEMKADRRPLQKIICLLTIIFVSATMWSIGLDDWKWMFVAFVSLYLLILLATCGAPRIPIRYQVEQNEADYPRAV